jgi:hypothetical protein
MVEPSGHESEEETEEKPAEEPALEQDILRMLALGSLLSDEELRRLEQVDHVLARKIASATKQEMEHRRELESSVLRRSTEVVRLLSGLAGGLVAIISAAAAVTGISGTQLTPVEAVAPLLLAALAALVTAFLQEKTIRKQPPIPAELKATMRSIEADREAMRRFAPRTASAEGQVH